MVSSLKLSNQYTIQVKINACKDRVFTEHSTSHIYSYFDAVMGMSDLLVMYIRMYEPEDE